ncbi:MAG: hypothetical protein WB566_12920 [Terriglobales bacterium]
MARTTLDLINELKETAAASGTAVAIVVAFKNTSSFVFAGDANGLEKLHGFIKQGGEPVGLISSTLRRKEGTVEVRALSEYEGDAHIREYLMTLAAAFGAQLEASGQGKIIGEKD